MNICSSYYRAVCVVALATAAATPTLAKDSGFFVGASLGQSKYDTEEFEGGLLNTTISRSIDDKDLAFALITGWRFNRYIGLEAGLHELGDIKVNEFGRLVLPTLPPTTVGAVTTLNAGGRGASLSLVGSLPLGKWELYAKAGGMYAETKLNIIVGQTNAAIVGFGEAKSETTELLYAAGAGYEFADEFFVRLEWMRVPDLGDEQETAESDVDVISLGLQYRF